MKFVDDDDDDDDGVIIYRSYKVLKWSNFWHTLYLVDGTLTYRQTHNVRR